MRFCAAAASTHPFACIESSVPRSRLRGFSASETVRSLRETSMKPFRHLWLWAF
jgi:hypothetical protein